MGSGTVICPLTAIELGAGAGGGVVASGPSECLFLLNWPPLHACECKGVNGQYRVYCVLVRNQVILICCIACGSRPYCESRRDNIRVSRCANGMCARTNTPTALTPHSATALKRFPEGKQGSLIRDRAGC